MDEQKLRVSHSEEDGLENKQAERSVPNTRPLEVEYKSSCHRVIPVVAVLNVRRGASFEARGDDAVVTMMGYAACVWLDMTLFNETKKDWLNERVEFKKKH